MNTKSLGLLTALTLTLAGSAFAGVNDYQVTGPVVEITDNMIAVQKEDGRWELKRDAGTKGTEGVKVGDKVTIRYTMTATSVEEKDKGAKKDSASPAASPKK